MEKYKMIIGIDISKKKLDAWFTSTDTSQKQAHLVVGNDRDGIKQMLKNLSRFDIAITNCLFCFENTGVYGMPLAYYLSELKANYCMVNTVEMKRSRGLTRGKNDKIDAKQIAHYALAHMHKLKLSQLAEKQIAQLKVLFAEREKLVKVIGIMNTSKELQGFMPQEIIEEVIQINKETVEMLEKQLKLVDQKMNKMINQNSKIHSQYELITSIPGIGKQTALYLIITTKCFEAFDNWRKLACYAGVAPFEYSSGSSVKGRTKVSHLADKKMKALLNMCALSIKRYDKSIKEYYERKVAEGKNPMLVMNNIRCKILSRVFATVNRGTPYVNTHKFAA